MLLEFKVGNYLSFKDTVTFTMVASNIKEHEVDNVFSDEKKKLDILKSAVIYGANASGKSNLFKSMSFLKNFIFNSSYNRPEGTLLNVDNFKLSSECDGEPSFFEISFIYEDVRYRYGFKVDQERVRNEWLFSAHKNRERKLFERTNQEFSIGRYFRVANKFTGITRKDTLLLSVAAQFNEEISGKILQWMRSFNIISGLNTDDYYAFTTKMLENEKFKKRIMEFLKIADLDIKDILIRKTTGEKIIESIPEELKKIIPEMIKKETEFINLLSSHRKYDKEKNVIQDIMFDFAANESHGTQTFYNLSGPILDTLYRGYILIIDELDSRLHPLLTRSIIKLFNSGNKKNSQLIFASHDTSMLSKDLFRRDQIWFTEKDRYGVTDLYSLLDYKVRNDALFGKDYILGKYGAIPFIGDYNFLFEDLDKNNNV